MTKSFPPADESPKDEESPSRRQAKVNCRDNGDAVGIAVFLTAGDLAELGIDPDTTDKVDIQIDDGELHLVPASCLDS